MTRFWTVLAGLALVGCAPDDPCARYVDYMCSCHADDTGFDCAELQRTYDEADPDVQSSCAVELSSQREEDEQAGVECVDSTI